MSKKQRDDSMLFCPECGKELTFRRDVLRHLKAVHDYDIDQLTRHAFLKMGWKT